MHKKTYLLASIAALILMSLLFASCASKPGASTQPQPAQTSAPTTLDGATLLNQRCTACHSLDKIESKHKTQDEWSKTVSRMVEKGAVLNTEEVSILVEYLTKTYGP